MRASWRFRAALQVGQRQRHFISWNRTTKETGSELIQAMALKGQTAMATSPTRTSIANSTLPFHEISRSYPLALEVHLHLRVIVRCKIEYDTRKTPAPGPALDEISISFCSLRRNGSLRPGARLKARHRRILDGDHGEFHTGLQPIAHYRKPREIRQSHD